MILNTGENIPDEFYIFVSPYPTTTWNLNLGKGFSSAGYDNCSDSDFKTKYLNGTVTYLPFQPSKSDLITISPYCMTAINSYRIEYDAEVCRSRLFPKYPSRLSATYAFGDYESCEKVHAKHGWDLQSIKKFKLVEDELTRVVKVNMEIVSLAKYAYRILPFRAEDIESLWKAYWQGNGTISVELPVVDLSKWKKQNSGEIWEYLIEGWVDLIE